MSKEEIEHYKAQFSEPGALTAAINYYRAMVRNGLEQDQMSMSLKKKQNIRLCASILRCRCPREPRPLATAAACCDLSVHCRNNALMGPDFRTFMSAGGREHVESAAPQVRGLFCLKAGCIVQRAPVDNCAVLGMRWNECRHDLTCCGNAGRNANCNMLSWCPAVPPAVFARRCVL